MSLYERASMVSLACDCIVWYAGAESGRVESDASREVEVEVGDECGLGREQSI